MQFLDNCGQVFKSTNAVLRFRKVEKSEKMRFPSFPEAKFFRAENLALGSFQSTHPTTTYFYWKFFVKIVK